MMQTDSAIVLDTPEQIFRFKLACLRAGVKMEIYGMKRRGRSACVIAKETLGLPKSARKEQVLRALEEALA